MHIHKLCTIVLEVMHKIDHLDVLFNVVAITQLQAQSRGVQTKGRGTCGMETRHTPIVIDAPLIDISTPPHQQLISSTTSPL